MLLLMANFHSFYGWVIFHYIHMYHIFIQSFVNGCLGCFHMLANNAALNTEAHASFQASVFVFSDIYVAVELLGHMMVFLFFVFLRSLHTVFHNGCTKSLFFFFSYNQNGFTFWNWDPCLRQVKREVPCWCTGSKLTVQLKEPVQEIGNYLTGGELGAFRLPAWQWKSRTKQLWGMQGLRWGRGRQWWTVHSPPKRCCSPTEGGHQAIHRKKKNPSATQKVLLL